MHGLLKHLKKKHPESIVDSKFWTFLREWKEWPAGWHHSFTWASSSIPESIMQSFPHVLGFARFNNICFWPATWYSPIWDLCASRPWHGNMPHLTETPGGILVATDRFGAQNPPSSTKPWINIHWIIVDFSIICREKISTHPINKNFSGDSVLAFTSLSENHSHPPFGQLLPFRIGLFHSFQQIATYQCQVECLPRCFTVWGGRFGLHVFMRKPPGNERPQPGSKSVMRYKDP